METHYVEVNKDKAKQLLDFEIQTSNTINTLTKKLSDERNKLRDSMNLYTGYCFLYYHYHRIVKNCFGEIIKTEDYDDVRIAWLSHWDFSADYLNLIPRFYSVNEKGDHNSRIYMEHKTNISFEPLGCSLSEARKIIKETKKIYDKLTDVH